MSNIIQHTATHTLDSREVAVMVDKRHDNLLRDINGYCEILTSSDLRALDFFIPSTYFDGKGETRPCYHVTKMGCEMVANKMTGEKGVLFTAAYVAKFNEMEGHQYPYYLPQTYSEALRLAADMAEQLEEQKPLVAFAETCAASEDSILIRELAKVASKSGIVTGEKRLYRTLRDWGLIFKSGTEPYQEYIDRGYFEVTQSPKETSKGVKVFKTTRVTPRGQMYIIDRLKKEAM